MKKKYKICMILYNPFISDSRVFREAKSLVEADYKVTVLAIKSEQVPTFENKEGIYIKRILKRYPPFGRPHPFRKKKSQISEAAKLAVTEKADLYHAHDF